VLAGVVLAQAVIFASGLGQVLLLTGRDLGVALALGVVPFLPGAAIKTALACAFVWTLDRFGPGPRDAGPGELRDEAV